MRAPAGFIALLCLGAVHARAQEIDAIYIVPLSHTDIGFTAPPSAVAAKMDKAGGEALEAARADPAYVWCFETFWQLEQWLDRHHDPAPMLELLRSGRFGVSAAYVDPHSSLMSAWALDQLFRLPVEWGRKRGLTLDWAVIDDVPGHPHDLPVFLARNGVKYLALGVNQSLSKPLPQEVSNTPFWWEGPDGSRVLTWISADSYTEAYTKYGIDPGTARFFAPKDFPEKEPLEVMRKGIERMLDGYRKRGYAYDSVIALHAFDNWGSGASRRLPEAVKTWNEADRAATGGPASRVAARPRLVLSTPREFFRHVEEKYGAALPVRRGGFGGQWELVRTGAPTAMARARAEEARLAASAAPDAAPDASRDAAPDAGRVAKLLVYWEHSFGMGVPWPKLLTRAEAVQHNLEQWDLVKGWPLENAVWASGETVTLPPRGEGDPFEPNGLYITAYADGKARFDPVPEAAWPLRRAERLANGALLLRHRIDRRNLPDPAHVIWTWKLTEEEIRAPVVLKTATGTMKCPDEGLAGYDPGHWIAPVSFRLARTEFWPHGIFVFSRPEQYKGWLVARVLDQASGAEFKGGERGAMKLDEAYPGEDPVFEFGVEVKGE